MGFEGRGLGLGLLLVSLVACQSETAPLASRSPVEDLRVQAPGQEATSAPRPSWVPDPNSSPAPAATTAPPLCGPEGPAALGWERAEARSFVAGDVLYWRLCGNLYALTPGAAPRRMARGVSEMEEVLAVDPQERYLLLLRGEGHSLWRRDLPGPEDMLLLDGLVAGSEASFSPAGMRVALQAVQDGKRTLYAVDVGTGRKTPMVEGVTLKGAWSPDGQAYAAWVQLRGAGDYATLCVFTLSDGRLKTYPPAEVNVDLLFSSFCWRADGRALFVVDQSRSRSSSRPFVDPDVLEIELGSGQVTRRTIMGAQGESIQYASLIAASPDGRWLLESRGLLDLATNRLHPIPPANVPKAWSGDGSKVLALRQAASGPETVWLAPADILAGKLQ